LLPLISSDTINTIPMDIEVKEYNDDITIVSIEGKIDLYAAPFLKNKIIELLDMEKKIIFDMSDVPYIDSSGMGILVSIKQKLKNSANLKFFNLQEAVAKLFKLTRMDTYFEVFGNFSDARKACDD